MRVVELRLTRRWRWLHKGLMPITVSLHCSRRILRDVRAGLAAHLYYLASDVVWHGDVELVRPSVFPIRSVHGRARFECSDQVFRVQRAAIAAMPKAVDVRLALSRLPCGRAEFEDAALRNIAMALDFVGHLTVPFKLLDTSRRNRGKRSFRLQHLQRYRTLCST